MTWKTTAKRKPVEGQQVLCYWAPAMVGGAEAYGVAVLNGGMWYEPEDDENDFREPTLWMPLPDLPVDGEVAK
jgi:hypothetical protein